MLVYRVIQSPLAQPRNLVGSHLIMGIVGVTVQKRIPDILWLSASLAVSFSIVFMQITKTLHPPGVATPLFAVTGSTMIIKLGYWYAITRVLVGALILLAATLIFNNITTNRHYPTNKEFTKIKNKIKYNIKESLK